MSDSAEDRLREIADAAARDIAADFPGLETEYDLYVDGLYGDLIGVVDMGDAFQEVYVWDGGDWHPCNSWLLSPQKAIDLILEKRGALRRDN